MTLRICFFALLALLGGCDTKNNIKLAGAQSFVDNQNINLKPIVLKKAIGLEKYQVNPKKYAYLRNPFSLYIKPIETKNNKLILDNIAESPNLNKTKSELEKIHLKQLKLLGVIIQDKNRWAIIGTKNMNKSFVVVVGDYIGISYGRISKITKNKITIEEKILSNNLNWVQHKTILKLRGA